MWTLLACLPPLCFTSPMCFTSHAVCVSILYYIIISNYFFIPPTHFLYPALFPYLPLHSLPFFASVTVLGPESLAHLPSALGYHICRALKPTRSAPPPFFSGTKIIVELRSLFAIKITSPESPRSIISGK